MTDFHRYAFRPASTPNQALLARLEYSRIRANGLLGALLLCLSEHQQEQWREQVAEVRRLLGNDVLDIIALEKELVESAPNHEKLAVEAPEPAVSA